MHALVVSLVAQGIALPTLECGGELTVSVGIVQPHEPVDVSIRLVNEGSANWQNIRSVVSCPACVQVQSSPDLLEVGESGDIWIRLIPGAAPGPHLWSAALVGADGGPTRMRIAGVVSGLRAAPRRCLLRAAGTEPAQREVTLEWFGESEMTGVTWSTTMASITLSSIEHVSKNQWRGTIKGTSVGLTSSSGNGVIGVAAIIKDHDGAQHRELLEIPVRHISDQDIRVVPSSIFLGSLHPDDCVLREVRITGANVGGALVDIDMDGLSVSSEAIEGDQLLLKMKWEGSARSIGTQRGTVVIRRAEDKAVIANLPVTAYILSEVVS